MSEADELSVGNVDEARVQGQLTSSFLGSAWPSLDEEKARSRCFEAMQRWSRGRRVRMRELGKEFDGESLYRGMRDSTKRQELKVKQS